MKRYSKASLPQTHKSFHYYDEWEGQRSYGMEIWEDESYTDVRYQNGEQSFTLRFSIKKQKIGFI